MIESTVSPALAVVNADQAVAFYETAFGAREIGPRLTSPERKILHTELQIGASTIMLAEAMPIFGTVDPKSLEGTPVRLSLLVENADATVEAAQAAGAKSLIPVADQFYGHRSGRIEDPFGHVWIISHVIEPLSQEEMQRRLDEQFSE